jgi:2-acylglycerol O-acyltransferase 2
MEKLRVLSDVGPDLNFYRTRPAIMLPAPYLYQFHPKFNLCSLSSPGYLIINPDCRHSWLLIQRPHVDQERELKLTHAIRLFQYCWRPDLNMVRWAPWQLPLQRRLQTTAVIGGLLVLPSVFIFLVALWTYPPFVSWYTREVFILYVLWQVLIDRETPKRGGRPLLWFRSFPAWKLIANYVPARLHTGDRLDAGKRHIFCLHPHGIISIAAICNLVLNVNGPNEKLGVDYRIVTVSANFIMPVWREIIMALGFIDASRESIANALEDDLSVMIVIGGAQETLHAKPGVVELVLKKRTGFVRLALEHGANLVPVFHFGENELYGQVSHPVLRRLQDWATRLLGFTLPVIRGRGIFQYDYGILPRRVELNTVVGKSQRKPE